MTNWAIIKPTTEKLEEKRVNQKVKTSSTKFCLYCKIEFDYGYVSLKVCGVCTIKMPCAVCGSEFERTISSFSGNTKQILLSSIFSKENLYFFCSNECKRISATTSFNLFLSKNPQMHQLASKKSMKEKVLRTV